MPGTVHVARPPTHGERHVSPTRHANTSRHLLSPLVTSPCEDTDCPQLFLAKRASCGKQPLSRGAAWGGTPTCQHRRRGRARGRYWGAQLARLCTALGRDAGGQVCSPLRVIPEGRCQVGALRTRHCPGSPCPVSRVPPRDITRVIMFSSRGRQRSPEGVPSGSLAITGSHLPQM